MRSLVHQFICSLRRINWELVAADLPSIFRKKPPKNGVRASKKINRLCQEADLRGTTLITGMFTGISFYIRGLPFGLLHPNTPRRVQNTEGRKSLTGDFLSEDHVFLLLLFIVIIKLHSYYRKLLFLSTSFHYFIQPYATRRFSFHFPVK